MKKLIIHIGYSKTATTSLQLNVFSPLNQEGKIEYLNHLNRENLDLGGIYCRNIVSYITGMDELAKCDEELKKIEKITNDISLISAETLTFFCEEFSWGSLNSHASSNAMRAKSVLSPVFDEICIIMTIRAQQTLIPSAYAQWFTQIKSTNKKTTLSQWLNDTFSKNKNDNELMFNFDQMYTSYINAFGNDNVHVLMYEDLKYDKVKFYEQLSTILNITTDKLALLLEKTVKNKTLKSGGNQLVTEPATLSDVFLSSVRPAFKKILPKKLFMPFRSVYRVSIGRMLSGVKVKTAVCIDNITEDERLFVQQRFQASNLNLAKKLKLDLAKLKQYGYLDQ
jgi:hypothetical protein